MKPETQTITRREALLSALQGTVAVSLAVALRSSGAEPPLLSETEFVPDNDYPFFGWVPEPLA